MNPAQKKADENERIIVRFTNIDNESFTHSYRGISITVGVGEEYVGRLPECEHLATHLARKMLSREAKKKTNAMDNKIKLWTPEQIEELKKKIISPVGTMEPNPKLTPEEERKKDLEDISKKVAPKSVPEVTKKDVIAELKKRGTEPDIKKTREELLQDLMALEAQGK